jgi:flagellar hook-basal body complex protein FliE
MEVSGVNSLASLMQKQLDSASQNQVTGASFNDLLKNAMNDVNQTQVEGYKAMEGIATGNVPNLQEAVQKIQEAELSLKLALEVKNKAVMGFKEIMKMPV